MNALIIGGFAVSIITIAGTIAGYISLGTLAVIAISQLILIAIVKNGEE